MKLVARIPPQAIEAEQNVLGALMLSPASLSKINIHADDFYRRDHQLIFRAILDLAADSKPYDAITLGEWFESRGLADHVDNGAYLIDLVSNTPSAANICAHATIVREKAILRSAIDIALDLINTAYMPDNLDCPEIIDGATSKLMALAKTDARTEYTMRQAVALAFQDAEEAYKHRGSIRGVRTGFDRIDTRLGGWHKRDLIFIGARPSMGKTALMVNLCEAASCVTASGAGHAVGIMSGEQSAMQMGQRAIAVNAPVCAERMRNGNFEDEDWPLISNAIKRLKSRNVFIDDRSAPTLDYIARTARRWKHEHDISVLFIDYLQRIRVPGAENRIEEVSEAARGLKTLAGELDIPVVCLAQVKAEVDKRPDKRPGLGDIANSDEATREADQILFLYRDEVYHPDTQAQGIAELNCEKNRHGPTGQFKLRFDAPTMRFMDIRTDGYYQNSPSFVEE